VDIECLVQEVGHCVSVYSTVFVCYICIGFRCARCCCKKGML